MSTNGEIDALGCRAATLRVAEANVQWLQGAAHVGER